MPANPDNSVISESRSHLGLQLGLNKPAVIDLAAKQFVDFVEPLILAFMDKNQTQQRTILRDLNVLARVDINKYDATLSQAYSRLMNFLDEAKQAQAALIIKTQSEQVQPTN